MAVVIKQHNYDYIKLHKQEKINEALKELTISTKPSWCIKQAANFNKVQNFTSWVAINNKNIQRLPQKICVWKHINLEWH